MGDYTTALKVAKYLNTPNFSSSTTPNEETVEDVIARVEENIENDTFTAFRERQVYQEYHNIDAAYIWGSGVPIPLRFRPILSFDTSKGDKLEVWDGSSWIDLTSTKTEGRTNDYWIQPPGKLWIVTDYAFFKRARVRVTYRYGDFVSTTITAEIAASGAAGTISASSTAGFQVSGRIRIDDEEFSYTGKTTNSFTGVLREKAGTTAAAHSNGATVKQIAKDVEDLATKMAVLELIKTNFKTNLIPVSGAFTHSEIIQRLEDEIDRDLRKHTNIQVL